jgi:hypothetical protein
MLYQAGAWTETSSRPTARSPRGGPTSHAAFPSRLAAAVYPAYLAVSGEAVPFPDLLFASGGDFPLSDVLSIPRNGLPKSNSVAGDTTNSRWRKPQMLLPRDASAPNRPGGAVAVIVNLDTTPVQLHAKPFQTADPTGARNSSYLVVPVCGYPLGPTPVIPPALSSAPCASGLSSRPLSRQGRNASWRVPRGCHRLFGSSCHGSRVQGLQVTGSPWPGSTCRVPVGDSKGRHIRCDE